MISKVITFKDDNNNALLPISDARAIQITYADVTKSVHDAILDTEEAIATTYNNLTSRIDGIEYDLNNPAVLNTNNTVSQTPMSNEQIEGNIYLHKIAKTGSWNDLINKPTIPAAPVKSNWNETNSSSLAYILNKPTIPAAPGTLNTNNTASQSVSSSESLSGNINLHRISKTGNYNDLTHYPYETKVLVSKHINTVGSTIITVPAGNFMISCTATGSTASFNITAEKSRDIWEWSTTDGKIFAEYEYVSDSSGTMTITVSGTPANDTDIVLTIYDVINGTGDYSSQLGLNGYIEGKRISRVGQVAVTNDYNDLINKPTIPAAPVKSNWNETNSSSLAYILNKPANVSAFTNDAGYLTQHQSLANYYTKTETNNNFSRKTMFDSEEDLESDNPTANLDFAYDDSNGKIYWSDINNYGGWKRLLDIDDLRETRVVNVTQSGTTYTMDISCMQVRNLIDSNYTVVLKYIDTYFHFAGRDQDDLHFVNIDVGHGYMYEFNVNGGSTGNTTYYNVINNINNKQNTLVSGTNIKTVNNESLLGRGNIDADDVIMGKLDGINFYKVTGYTSQFNPQFSSTPETGTPEKIYVDILTNKAYRWNKEPTLIGTSRYKLLSEELSVITDSEINASQPGTTKRAVSAEVLLNNFYTETEVDNALSLKQNIDDVYVDQAYVDTNTTNSFTSNNKRYNIAEDITLTTDATYAFGSGCILHFYNAGKLNGAANLALNNTQIEAPLKQCFDLNVNFTGLMRNSECYPEWWGAAGDGETDDADAINRCILCACHTPVVLTAENYLVKSTIGCEESIANSAANTAAHQSSVNYQYSSQLIIKHNIIGDATLTEPVVRFAVSHGLCNIYGSIIVRNSSDDCVGFTSFPSVGGEFGASNSEIYINTIFKGDWANHYYADATYRTTYGVGNGVGAVLHQFNGKITIDYIGGFKHGVYMSRIINSVIHVGSCESTYCFYLGTPKDAWHNVNYNWYVTRNKVFLGKQVITNKNVNYIPFITDVADSAVIKEDGTQEISLNEFTIGDSNNGDANLRHPHKHSLYYTYDLKAGHTGNVYNFNITYAIETSRKFIKFVFPSAPQSTNMGPNGDEINFGIGCFLKDIDIPYSWNVKLNNVILSNTAKTKGTFRWMGGSGEMLVDTVTVTRASTPIFDSGSTTIYLLDINPQFKGSAVSVSSAPSTCDNNKFYVVDNPITTNGTKKYPVYYNYFGAGATLIGYTLDDYKDNDPRVSRINVAGGTVTSAMEPDKLFVFGSTTTPCTSLTLTLTAGDSNYAEYYHGVVFCGANMTLSVPNTVVQSENRALPSFAAGDIFEFEILNIATNKYLMHFSHTPAS